MLLYVAARFPPGFQVFSAVLDGFGSTCAHPFFVFLSNWQEFAHGNSVGPCSQALHAVPSLKNLGVQESRKIKVGQRHQLVDVQGNAT